MRLVSLARNRAHGAAGPQPPLAIVRFRIASPLFLLKNALHRGRYRGGLRAVRHPGCASRSCTRRATSRADIHGYGDAVFLHSTRPAQGRRRRGASTGDLRAPDHRPRPRAVLRLLCSDTGRLPTIVPFFCHTPRSAIQFAVVLGPTCCSAMGLTP